MKNMRLAENPKDSVATTEEIAERRKAGYTVILVMEDGTTYRPFGGGMSMAGGNIQIVSRADALFDSCERLLRVVEHESGRVVGELERAYGQKLSELQLTLTLDSQNNPVFIDRNLNPPLRLGASTEKPAGSIELIAPGFQNSNSVDDLRWPTWAQDAA